jgi:hypothetical protein
LKGASIFFDKRSSTFRDVKNGCLIISSIPSFVPNLFPGSFSNNYIYI